MQGFVILFTWISIVFMKLLSDCCCKQNIVFSRLDGFYALWHAISKSHFNVCLNCMASLAEAWHCVFELLRCFYFEILNAHDIATTIHVYLIRNYFLDEYVAGGKPRERENTFEI